MTSEYFHRRTMPTTTADKYRAYKEAARLVNEGYTAADFYTAPEPPPPADTTRHDAISLALATFIAFVAVWWLL